MNSLSMNQQESSPTPSKDGHVTSRPMELRAVVSGALGSALEYFDFAVYGALSATIFPSLFFSELGATGAILAPSPPSEWVSPLGHSVPSFSVISATKLGASLSSLPR
jgi:hypothetical protein